MKDKGKAGIGVVVRNEEGRPIDGLCGAIKMDCAIMAKALAVREGIKLAMTKGYQKMEVAMDSKIVHLEIIRQRGVK